MALDEFFVPAPSDIVDNMLRVERNMLIDRGVPSPNLTHDSDYFIRATSLAQQLAIGYANTTIKADQQMPDSATGEDLARILAIYGLDKRPAQGSSGSVILNTSAPVTIGIGAQLIDAAGNVFQVTTGGVYSNGSLVPITGVSTGKGTNHAAGDVLQWIAPLGFDPKALVATGGLIDGVNADDDEAARNRLLNYFRNPPTGGNATQIMQWAAQASAAVKGAYVYPALNGPGTWGVCLAGILTFDATLGWNRGLSGATVTAVDAYLVARMPEHSKAFVFSPLDTVSSSPCIDTEISIGVSLPFPVTANGPGGGWTDATPWPALNGSATRVYVSVATSSTDITLTSDDSGTTPSTLGLIAGSTTIAWFSSAQFAAGQNPMVVATVLSIVSGTTGAVRVTLDTPFTGVIAGDFVCPNAENIQVYVTAMLGSMELMGPGQWSTNPGVVPTANREPLVTVSNPSDLTSTLLRAISDSGEEVLDIAYLYRSVSTPGVPSDTTTKSPKILVPKRLGLFNKIP